MKLTELDSSCFDKLRMCNGHVELDKLVRSRVIRRPIPGGGGTPIPEVIRMYRGLLSSFLVCRPIGC